MSEDEQIGDDFIEMLIWYRVCSFRFQKYKRSFHHFLRFNKTRDCQEIITGFSPLIILKYNSCKIPFTVVSAGYSRLNFAFNGRLEMVAPRKGFPRNFASGKLWGP